MTEVDRGRPSYQNKTLTRDEEQKIISRWSWGGMAIEGIKDRGKKLAQTNKQEGVMVMLPEDFSIPALNLEEAVIKAGMQFAYGGKAGGFNPEALPEGFYYAKDVNDEEVEKTKAQAREATQYSRKEYNKRFMGTVKADASGITIGAIDTQEHITTLVKISI